MSINQIYKFRSKYGRIGSINVKFKIAKDVWRDTKTDPDTQVADQISSVSITEPLPVQLPEDVKQEMTMKLSQQTNMNLQWSLKCLEELSWNYDNAFSVYEMFKKQSQIPAVAFSKQEYCTWKSKMFKCFYSILVSVYVSLQFTIYY